MGTELARPPARPQPAQLCVVATQRHCVIATQGHCVVATQGHCVVATQGHCVVATQGHCVIVRQGHCVIVRQGTLAASHICHCSSQKHNASRQKSQKNSKCHQMGRRGSVWCIRGGKIYPMGLPEPSGHLLGPKTAKKCPPSPHGPPAGGSP